MTGRQPKVGEVWTTWADSEQGFECVVDEQDALGRYVWRTKHDEYMLSRAGLSAPPPVPRPPLPEPQTVLEFMVYEDSRGPFFYADYEQAEKAAQREGHGFAVRRRTVTYEYVDDAS